MISSCAYAVVCLVNEGFIHVAAEVCGMNEWKISDFTYAAYKINLDYVEAIDILD